MSAETVVGLLAGHRIVTHDSALHATTYSCSCRDTGPSVMGHTMNPRVHAGHQLDVVEGAGYAIVKVPKPVGVNGEDNAVWLRSPYIEQSFSGEVVISDRLAIDANELRDVAAALLAAADAAEQVSA